MGSFFFPWRSERDLPYRGGILGLVQMILLELLPRAQETDRGQILQTEEESITVFSQNKLNQTVGPSLEIGATLSIVEILPSDGGSVK
jgi:hypothetical protein